MVEIYTIKKQNVWKNGKGAFVLFDERPETFYYFGVKALEVGQKVNCSYSAVVCGDIKGSCRLDSITVLNSAQKTLPSTSAIVEAAKSTGAKLYTPVSDVGNIYERPSSKDNDFLIHELLAKQVEKIVEHSAVIDKLISQIREHERKLQILQDKVGVSFI